MNKRGKTMYRSMKKSLVFLAVLCLILSNIRIFADVKPDTIRLSKEKLVIHVGKILTIKSKGKAGIRVRIEPKEAKSDIVVRSDNDQVVKVKKVDKYFYKIKALKEGKTKLFIYSKINPKLKKVLKITVRPEKETGKKQEPDQNNRSGIRLADFTLTQSTPDWEYPNNSEIKGMGLNTRGMKLFVRLEDENKGTIDSSEDKNFSFRSSNDKIFKMFGNTIIPVQKGRADIVVSYKDKEYECIPVSVSIGDYARPVSVVFNQNSTMVHSYGTDKSINLKAVYDQYGNEMDLNGAEWSFSCWDNEINPTASLIGSTVYIDGNGAFAGIYRMNVDVIVFGVPVSSFFDIVVRP